MAHDIPLTEDEEIILAMAHAMAQDVQDTVELIVPDIPDITGDTTDAL